MSPHRSCEETQVGREESQSSKVRRQSPVSPHRSSGSPGRSVKRLRINQGQSYPLSPKVVVGKIEQQGSEFPEFAELGVLVKPEMSNKTVQFNSGNLKGLGSLSDSLPETANKATQISKVMVSSDSQATETASKKSIGLQSFEEDPWQGLLSEDEVCQLIKVDTLIGHGIKEQPEALFESHSINSKRVMSKGIIYQVVVIKEQYTKETEIIKTIEVPCKKQKVKTDKEVEIIEVIDIESDKPEESGKEGGKEVIEIKDEKVEEEESVKFEEEITTFKEKPWANLRKKIVEKQDRNTPEPVPDNRTPYQRCTEEPQSPGLVPLEINAHILLALKEVDDFLSNKSSATPALLPMSVGKRVMDQYKSFLEPGFALTPELAIQLEGLLSGIAFSGVAKKSAAVSTGDLEKLGQSAFNIVEITSFMMAAIAVIEGGLEKVSGKVKGPALALLSEYKPFLGSLDKACRHIVRESLALMSSFIMKQRQVLASCFSTGLPKSFRSRLIKAPLASFQVAPSAEFEEVKREYEGFVQKRAFANAVANVGFNRFRGTSRIVRQKTTILSRGTRPRGQLYRGNTLGRGFRGQLRGSLRGVRRSGLSGRNMRGFARRDRAVGRDSDNQVARVNPNIETAGYSGNNQL